MIDPSTLPTNPGVYLFKNSNDEIIYVGKAKNLRNRVRSYFSKQDKSPKTHLLVTNISHMDHIIVDNEVEALLLENKLIKKHQPKYNIMLKDSKTFAYIKVTDEKFPRVLQTRRVTKSGTYFGPFTDATAKNELLQLANKIFSLRVCRTLPKRACLNYHIGICSAPCINKITKEQYSSKVDQAISFLKGNTKEIQQTLQKEMKEASEKLRYEVALEKKRQLDAIDFAMQRQKVDLVKQFDQHVIAIKHEKQKALITLFSIVRGVISGKKEYQFDDEDDILQSFLKLYYSKHKLPTEIILSEPCWADSDEKKIIETYLTKMRGAKVNITLPQMGEKKSIVDLALKNIVTKTIAPLKELQEKLNLSKYPSVIECFDISNLSYDYVVGAMTQWVDGNPNKEEYRKFEIKSVDAQDDFASMHEVVHRRYKRLDEEKKQFPDLIIIDGGPGQLNASLDALKELGLQIPIVSLAKKEEEIYLPNEENPLQFDKNSEMMLLVRKIRDSVHKFVLGYNRKKREMRMRDSAK